MIGHLTDKSKSKDDPLTRKDYQLLGVAIIIGALAVGVYFYLNSPTEEGFIDPVASNEALEFPDESLPVTIKSESVENPVPEPVLNPEETENIVPKEDPLFTNQRQVQEAFKDKIRLGINLPPDMNFQEVELDAEVAAMVGSTPNGDRKMAVLAAYETATPEKIAAFLRDQKARIPFLNQHNFTISGDLRTLPGPKDSGISKITLIPGGKNEGTLVYAAHLERSDKKGSYVILLQGTESYFNKNDGELESMLSSLSVKN